MLDRMKERRTLHGVRVTVTNPRPDVTSAHLFAKIQGALALVAEYQPMRLRRLQRDLAEIRVRPQPTHRASFYRESRSCVLDLFFVDTFTEAMIASSIVHEGMHARIQAAGVTGVSMPREERACRRAELRFGIAIPGGEEVAERARWALSLSDEEIAPLWRPG
jgi:hypothetical protein